MTGLAQVRQALHGLQQAGLRRTLRTCHSACAPQLTVSMAGQDASPMLAFASNDYLGLAGHPALRAALIEGVQEWGVGSGASHLISGHYAVHEALEARLAASQAAHIPQAGALYLGSGYLANSGLLPALAALAPSEIFSADLNHASIIDGCRLARCPAQVWPHQDLAQLAAQLQASRAQQKIVVTDAVFSMDGVIAPLAALLALCEEYDAWLVLDDAHGFGVLGAQGHGALEHAALHSERLIYLGTLGKAAGVGGAFIAAHADLIEWLRQKMRSYIFTTASAPALACALLAALDLIEGTEGRTARAHLQDLRTSWQSMALPDCWPRLTSPTAIQALLLGENQAALDLSHALWRRGVWVPAIRPPTVPAGTARLRITLSAAHSLADLQRLQHALQAIHREGL
ncbi:8-amino-7-oxononanoate synthase [Massilia sp. W12]|uniref:8-amino-7-oxononanoate synthase n=1 Tax=Massilia sp. W12 TaxID=3126507 RepID=UPI0030D4596B